MFYNQKIFRRKSINRPQPPTQINSNSEKKIENIIRFSILSSDYIKQGVIHEHQDLKQLILSAQPNHIVWIDIELDIQSQFLRQLSEIIYLHELVIEDLSNHHQRPKVEKYPDYLFIISRMIYMHHETPTQKVMVNEQVGFLMFKNLLITFQEPRSDCFEEFRQKLTKTSIPHKFSEIEYLTHGILDSLVDQYFPVLDFLNDNLDALEERILFRYDKAIVRDIQDLKRQIFFLRKTIWAERDKLNELMKMETWNAESAHHIYMRDTYDHAIQILDITESQKEMALSLMELFMSSQNNRLSEVMKVLTVISSIFIPLTFIAGVYGMNFSHIQNDGREAPWNMPELFHPWGYLTVMGLMGFIAISQIIYFRRKGWL